MKVYTKGGDDGSTGLFGGQRVPKDDVRVSAYGQVDEVNSALGLAVAACNDEGTLSVLQRIQGELLILGSELAYPEGQRKGLMIEDAHVAQLERWIDEASEELEPLTNFILPTGSETAARLHFARTVCRRAERAVATLSREQHVDRAVSIYLNRLSDLLFVFARRANHRAGVPDVAWNAEEPS